jgi:hypothetical protein
MDDPAQPASTNPADDLAQLTSDPLPSFADEVNQFEEQQTDYQSMYNQGGHFKEQLEAIAQKLGSLERSGPHEAPVQNLQEVAINPEIETSSEIAGYMEVVEKEAELKNPIHDDYTNQILLAPAANQNPVITLPLTQEQVQVGLHHKVWEAVTWLATWCLRQARLRPAQVKYKS